MKNWIKNIGFLVVGISLFTQCNNSNSTSCEKTMCTMEFRMITVSLKDSTGNDYIPDKVETYLNGTLIHYDSIPAVPAQNVYTIVDDSNLQALQLNVNKDVNFKVIKNGSVIKEQVFTVKADCCHVSKVSGVDTIQIQL